MIVNPNKCILLNLKMSIRAQIIQKELSNVSLQKDLGFLVNSNLKTND